MGRPFSILLCLCFVAVRGSHASGTPEEYWKYKLPTTPMPQSIKDSLPSGLATNSIDNSKHYDGLAYAKDSTKDLIASTKGYDGLLSYAKDSAKNLPSSTNDAYGGLLSYGKDSAKDLPSSTNDAYGGLLSYGKDSAKNLPSSSNDDAYGGLLSYGKDSTKDSLASTNGYDGLLSYAKPSRKLLQYEGLLSYGPKASPKCNTHESPTSSTGIMEDAVFFVESDLHHGKKMNLIFKKGTKKSFFLPRELANKIPFSSNKLSEIYNILAMDPKSQEAYVVSRRIELCEEPKVEGVEKKCVTSLESMVDFVTSKIGNNLQSLTTNLEKDHPKMEYTLKKVEKISKNDHETVVCHKMGYPYALFFCHGTATIRSYMVSLLGTDGTTIEAVAACHKETNDFLTNYMVNVLKVVPGSTRVCHFPGAEDNIIWVAN